MEQNNINDILGIESSQSQNNNEKKATITEQKDNDGNGKSYLSLIGGFIALISFFGPWAGCSDFSKATVSGMDIAESNNEFYLILLSSIVIIVSFLYFKSKRELLKSKIYILSGSIISLVIILYKIISIQSKPMASDIVPKWGLITTIIGFILSIIGVAFLKNYNELKPDVANNNNLPQFVYCQYCGNKIDLSEDPEFCNKCGKKIEIS